MLGADSLLREAEDSLRRYIRSEDCVWCRDKGEIILSGVSNLIMLKKLAEKAIEKEKEFGKVASATGDLVAVKEEGLKATGIAPPRLQKAFATELADRILRFKLQPLRRLRRE